MAQDMLIHDQGVLKDCLNKKPVNGSDRPLHLNTTWELKHHLHINMKTQLNLQLPKRPAPSYMPPTRWTRSRGAAAAPYMALQDRWSKVGTGRRVDRSIPAFTCTCCCELSKSSSAKNILPPDILLSLDRNQTGFGTKLLRGTSSKMQIWKCYSSENREVAGFTNAPSFSAGRCRPNRGHRMRITHLPPPKFLETPSHHTFSLPLSLSLSLSLDRSIRTEQIAQWTWSTTWSCWGQGSRSAFSAASSPSTASR